ncbi:MAG: ABC transporter substrate-binding protein, partial [Firmicutes bacterium]|nr:ABC transporter substrate-binding protein [Bacillota bacterium]
MGSVSPKHRKTRRALTAVAVAALTGISMTMPQVGAHAATTSTAGPVHGGTLTLDLQQNFPSLDPAIAYDPISYTAVEEMFNELVTYKGATNQLVPDLATWTTSANGKVYTFHMKKATFWNGAPVTANSFIAEIERVLSKKVNSPGQG